MEKNAPKKHKPYEFRVICRVRPVIQRELHYEATNPNTEGASLTILNSHAVSLTLSSTAPPFLFQFHKVIPPDATEQDFFEHVARPAVHDMLRGVSNTILAYGQTGSGKTHSIFGRPGHAGLVPLSGQHLFALINERPAEKLVVTCSFYEIYNESITDWLSDRPTERLPIREKVDQGIYIEGLIEERVTSAVEFDQVIARGTQNELVQHTHMSTMSTRSHTIVHINLHRESDSNAATTVSRLVLADLAGSERTAKSGVTGMALKEVSVINKSLATLSKCIRALHSKERFVPYRDSKLTRVLTTSLRGDNKTTILVTCSPHYTTIEETRSTLRFGKAAYIPPNIGAIVIELRTVLTPVDRGLFGVLPAELVLAILLHLTQDLLTDKQATWLITQLDLRQLPNKSSKDLWLDLIELSTDQARVL